MADFEYKRDYKFILWKETYQVNVIRALVAGAILSIIMMGGGGAKGTEVIFMFFVPFLCIPISMFCHFLSRLGVPWIGLVTFLLAFWFVPAGPIVYAIHKSRPDLVPIKKIGFIEFSPFIYVIDEDRQQVALG